MKYPDIAVLIPHYNNPEGLKKSLSSISSLELVDAVIVDDGSNIKPEIAELKNKFPLINDIEIIYLPENRGIEMALNSGLKQIHESEKQYKYVARMDCGDESLPERFKEQKDFLENNNEVYLVSNWVYMVDLNGNILYTYKLPLNHDKIKKKVYVSDPIFHASAMFRVSAIDRVGYYPTKYKNCEDTAYFFKFIREFKAANIGKVLYKCEQNPNGISYTRYRKIKLSRIKFAFNHFSLRYAFYFLLGLIKNTITFILGPKTSIKIGEIIQKYS